MPRKKREFGEDESTTEESSETVESEPIVASTSYEMPDVLRKELETHVSTLPIAPEIDVKSQLQKVLESAPELPIDYTIRYLEETFRLQLTRFVTQLKELAK